VKKSPPWNSTLTSFASFIDVTRLKTEGTTLSIVGSEKDAIIVRYSLDDDRHVDWWFDKATGLPKKSVQPYPLKPGTTSETLLSDYKDFDGGMVPTRITSRAEGALLVDITILEAKFVKKWDESVFGKP
jgi:hypothetical protein